MTTSIGLFLCGDVIGEFLPFYQIPLFLSSSSVLWGPDAFSTTLWKTICIFIVIYNKIQSLCLNQIKNINFHFFMYEFF